MKNRSAALEGRRGMTVSEVAHTLGLSDATVREMVRRGELKAHRISNAEWRILSVDFDAYLARTDVARWL